MQRRGDRTQARRHSVADKARVEVNVLPCLSSLTMVRLHLSWLVTIVVMMTVVPSIRGDCPAVHPECFCSYNIISCQDLGDISQVPPFKHSNTVYNSLVIGGKTTLSTVQTGAFNGLKVKNIRLNTIGITAIQSGAFSDLNDTLVSLYLDHNKLETMPEDVFGGLDQLRTLHLGNNQLKIAIPTWFSHTPALRVLFFDGNNLQTMPDDIFNDLHQLVHLFLSDNDLKTVKTAWFRQLTNLKSLYLEKNQLETIPEDAFQELNSLTTLWLNSNCLKTLSYALVPNKTQFESLTLYGNPLECDCRLAWVRAMADILSTIHIALCASPPPVNGTEVVAYDISMCAATTTETGILSF